jgi:hypothetical protein
VILTRPRQFLLAAATFALAGCLPGSSGPSIPPIPSGEARASTSSPSETPKRAQPGKKFSPRVLKKTQTSPRSRPPSDE